MQEYSSLNKGTCISRERLMGLHRDGMMHLHTFDGFYTVAWITEGKLDDIFQILAPMVLESPRKSRSDFGAIRKTLSKDKYWLEGIILSTNKGTNEARLPDKVSSDRFNRILHTQEEQIYGIRINTMQYDVSITSEVDLRNTDTKQIVLLSHQNISNEIARLFLATTASNCNVDELTDAINSELSRYRST
jgi:hypothetical protein